MRVKRKFGSLVESVLYAHVCMGFEFRQLQNFSKLVKFLLIFVNIDTTSFFALNRGIMRICLHKKSICKTLEASTWTLTGTL